MHRLGLASSSVVYVLVATAIAASYHCTCASTASAPVATEKKVSYFIHETNEDISALPSSPVVSRIISDGVAYYAKLTNRYRLLSLGSLDVGDDVRQYYCRIPRPLTSQETNAIAAADVVDNEVLISNTRAGIYELLMSLDCFVGAGDHGFQDPPPMFKYCPLGAFYHVDDAAAETEGTSHPFEDGAPPHETTEASTQRILLGLYDGTQTPRWNKEAAQWELRLAEGELCRNLHDEHRPGRRYETLVVFRCAPLDRQGEKVIWLVTRRDACRYTVELETTAVCAWHAALAATRMCPVPCLSV